MSITNPKGNPVNASIRVNVLQGPGVTTTIDVSGVVNSDMGFTFAETRKHQQT